MSKSKQEMKRLAAQTLAARAVEAKTGKPAQPVVTPKVSQTATPTAGQTGTQPAPRTTTQPVPQPVAEVASQTVTETPVEADATAEKDQESWDERPWEKFTKQEKKDPGGRGTRAGATTATPPRESFTYTHDTHGSDKHFRGAHGLKQGAQWGLNRPDAETIMRKDVTDNLATLLANAPEGKVTTFYLVKQRTKPVGQYRKNGEDFWTNTYTVQIDVNRKESEIVYHGYPDVETFGPGLGLSKNNLNLPFK